MNESSWAGDTVRLAMRASGRERGVRVVDDTLDLEQAQKQAADLLQAVKVGDQEAIRRLRHPHDPIRLADAQFAIAQEMGFQDWPDLVKILNGRALRSPVPVRTAAEQFLDAFIDLHRAASLYGPGYRTWRELRAFEAVASAVDQLEFALECASAQAEPSLLSASKDAVIAFRRLHEVGADDSDGELYQALDDEMINLGSIFGRFHTRP
jgi:hypothetical protein